MRYKSKIRKETNPLGWYHFGTWQLRCQLLHPVLPHVGLHRIKNVMICEGVYHPAGAHSQLLARVHGPLVFLGFLVVEVAVPRDEVVMTGARVQGGGVRVVDVQMS